MADPISSLPAPVRDYGAVVTFILATIGAWLKISSNQREEREKQQQARDEAYRQGFKDGGLRVEALQEEVTRLDERQKKMEERMAAIEQARRVREKELEDDLNLARQENADLRFLIDSYILKAKECAHQDCAAILHLVECKIHPGRMADQGEAI